ncbi:methyltransferase domain-containing protein, partial [Mycobacterium tuberculosis]
VDVIFSNLCLQWVEDLPAVFAGFRRALKPGGLLLVSTFGPETLIELRDAFAAADDVPHVSRFAPIAQFGDALMMSGFRDPVL